MLFRAIVASPLIIYYRQLAMLSRQTLSLSLSLPTPPPTLVCLETALAWRALGWPRVPLLCSALGHVCDAVLSQSFLVGLHQF